MSNTAIKGLDRQQWVSVAPAPNAHAAGMGIAVDLRTHGDALPYIAQLASATILNRYSYIQKAWNFMVSPALGGTFGAGAGCVMAPSRGLVGAVGTGSTTTRIVTSTTITAVAPNMFANRGDGIGFKLRVVGSASGSSGKTEEREIVGNTGGTTPTLLLATPLSFSPINGDVYEIVACRIFMLSAGTTASGVFKSLEVATNTLAAALATTNLPATIGTDFSCLALDEQYNPYNMRPGEGFLVGTATYNGGNLRCLQATASASGTLTGQSSNGDAAVLANEYRNFQIRVVEDTSIPTAVGQRRIIASHTAGASPVYTLGTAWTVTPSSNAKFVIELPNLLILRSSATTSIYTYNYSGNTINNGTNSINNDAWSATYFAAAGNAMGAGCIMFPSHGIQPDSAKNARHSYIYCLRGGNSSAVDMFDIAGGTTGAWSNTIVVDGAITINTGTCGKYSPHCCEGRFGYFNAYVASQINQLYSFDVLTRTITPVTATDWIQSGTAASGDRICTFPIINGDTSEIDVETYTGILLVMHLSTIAQELIIQF